MYGCVCMRVCVHWCVHACIHLRISSSLSASHPSLGRTWVLSILWPQALSWPGQATQAMHSVLATGGLQECEGVGWMRWRRSRLPGSSTESLLWQSRGHPLGPAIPSFPHSQGAHSPDQRLREQRRGWASRKSVGVSLGTTTVQEVKGQGGREGQR